MYISENQRISLFVLSIDFHFRILILEKIRIERILSKRTFASVVKQGTFHDFISGSPVDLMSLPRGLL